MKSAYYLNAWKRKPGTISEASRNLSRVTAGFIPTTKSLITKRTATSGVKRPSDNVRYRGASVRA
jgi:hypothetical protein